MQIVIRTRHTEMTDALRDRVQRRLHFAFDWAERSIGRISVVLSDLNGPRGGVDKRCRVLVVLPGWPDLIVEDTESDFAVAIDRAVDRAGRSLSRRLARQHDYRVERAPEVQQAQAPGSTV